jgi:uncharacterized membrane protein YfcA
MGIPDDPAFYAVAFTTIFAISFFKGGFGGGFATLGIPFLALVMDPLDAAIMMAPLVAFMDVFALNAYRRETWSIPDLKLLAPALVLGIGIGFLAFIYVDQRLVVIAIASITLVFTVRWFLGGGRDDGKPLEARMGNALPWGTMAGFTTFVAHSGGPPLQIYLLRRGLTKTVYAGTSAMFFAMGNVMKLPPYLYLGGSEPHLLWTALVLAPSVPLGVWLGRKFHDRLDGPQLYRWCYILLFLAGAKLMFDGVSGFLR